MNILILANAWFTKSERKVDYIYVIKGMTKPLLGMPEDLFYVSFSSRIFLYLCWIYRVAERIKVQPSTKQTIDLLN